MNYFWGAVAYFVMGIVFNELMVAYIEELCDKVAKIDRRFIPRLFVRLKGGRRTIQFKRFMLVVFWPIADVAVILKAGDEYDRLRRNDWKGRAL